MRFTAVALAGFAAVAYAQQPTAEAAPGTMVPITTEDSPAAPADVTTADDDSDPDINNLYKGPFGFPPGIMKPPHKKELPHKEPPKDAHKGKDHMPVWHPSHKGVFIDDCDDDKDDKWHWAHKTKKHPKPMIPHHKWVTSTVTATKTKTVFDCPDHVKECPGKPKTHFTTTTVEVTTTICPVPITDVPKPMPHPPKPEAPVSPPKPTGAVAPPPGPPAPPMSPPKPTVAPPAPASPPSPVKPSPPSISKPPAVVEAGATHNAVGALAAVAAFVALLI